MPNEWLLILLVAVSAAFGSALVGWIRSARGGGASQLRQLRAREAALAARLEDRDASIRHLTEELAEARRSEHALGEKKASLEADLRHQQQTAEERLALVETADTRLREAFRALSAETLDASRKSFLEMARESFDRLQEKAISDLEQRRKAVDDLVKPIEQSIQKVGEALQSVEKERARTFAELREQVRHVARTQESLAGETARLVQALRSPSARGRWGEIQLRRVVEMAGMVEHCDFVEQTGSDGDRGRQRPDLVVRLPGGKSVVVDAKVPLAAYLEAMEATDETVRRRHLEDHARQVRDHVRLLGQKSYWEQFQPAPEFVVMFLPGETFFGAALEQDPALIEFGVDRFVIPASPTTLIALLRSVHYGWQQERVAEGARHVQELGRLLYDRLRVMAGHLDDVGKSLDRAVASYNRTASSFERRVLVTARKFREFGSATSGDLPEPRQSDTSPRQLAPMETEDD
jgi:DNA recombination protein RmuC